MRNKLKHISFIFLFLTGVTLFSSCFYGRKKNIPSYADPSPGALKAKVVNYEVDGCKWLLELDNGKKLQPIELAPQFHKDKMKVWILYESQKDAMSNCMAGEIIKLTEIKLRE